LVGVGVSGFTAGHVAADEANSADLNRALFGADDAVYQGGMVRLYVRMNKLANLIPLASRAGTVACRVDLVTMAPSTLQAQEDVLQGVETFELRA
jgi:hypothetical protein